MQVNTLACFIISYGFITCYASVYFTLIYYNMIYYTILYYAIPADAGLRLLNK